MKKIFFTFLSIIAAAFVVLLFSNYDRYSLGAPEGYTGSPGDGTNCSVCHTHMSTPTYVSDMITSDVGVNGYLPGVNYTISVTLTDTGQKGFEVSPQNLTGDLLGTLTAGTDNQLVGSGKYVTQTAAAPESSKTWTFTWTAPPQGTGSVTFYGAGTCGKNTTKLSTLVIPEDNTTSLNGNEIFRLNIFPNIISDNFNISYYLDEESYVISKLYDINGKLVETLIHENSVNPGNYVKIFNINASLKKGLYFLNFHTKNKTITKRVFVM